MNRSEEYHARTLKFTGERDVLVARSQTLSRIRAGVFLLGFVLLVAGLWDVAAAFRTPTLAAGVICFIAFAILVSRHRRIQQRVRWFEDLVHVSTEAERRTARDWERLAATHAPIDEAEWDRTSGRDLDIYGHASLMRLLATSANVPGQLVLASWFREPTPPPEILRRQEAVSELAHAIDFREHVTVLIKRAIDHEPAALRRFLEWAESPGPTPSRTFVWITRLIPVVTTLLIVANLLGAVPYVWWAVSVLVAIGISAWKGREHNAAYKKASWSDGVSWRYSHALELIANAQFRSPVLVELRNALMVDGHAAHEQIRRLGNLTALADIRLSMVHFVLQALFLWDFHIHFAIEQWRRHVGRHARGWFDTIGKFEALSAIGALRYDQPEWSFPQFDVEGEPRIEATGLGHPLLPNDIGVTNDIAVGPRDTFLMITGSNMSGKTTFLRAIGMNVVLAEAGGPVCAREMRLCPVTVCSSIRIDDSLERGVSKFMAELERLAIIVERAEPKNEGARPVLYLIDEMLQGTNAMQRRMGARRVLRRLLKDGAIGAVATHDLTLADEEPLTTASQPFYFREFVAHENGRPILSFDYKLRPGLAVTTNALELMDRMGLGE